MTGHQHAYGADVVVFGAGPAGIAAAIAAAREGLEVHLVELQNRIGGVMASCPGMMLGGGYPCKKSIGGFFEEFVTRMVSENPPVAERRVCSLANFGDEVVYDPEYAVAILEDLLEKSGVKLLINHIPSELMIEHDSIHGIEVIHSQGCDLMIPKMVIDCTGNGDIASRAGVPSQVGNDAGLMMGVSLTFFMEDVDWDKAFAEASDPYFTQYAARGIAQGRIHESIPQIYMLKGFRKGSVFFNTVTVTGIDGRSSESVMAGTRIARRRVLDLARFCKEELPGFEHSHLAHVGPAVGVRETRKLEGMYRLTYDDVARGTRFEDGIVACDNPLDEVFRNEETTLYSHEAALKKGSYYTIPFRTLVPKRIRNLLFAGRNMSVDCKAFASVRGMPQCMAMGQSAGIGAAVAIQDGCDVQVINIKKLIKKLIALGVHGIGNHPLN